MKERIEEAVNESVARWRAGRGLGAGERVAVTVPKERAHGDFATTAALVLAKEAGVPARTLAQELVEDLGKRLAGVAQCELSLIHISE
ncbi:MAG: hypothetical protein N2595_10075, partial [bacterium]|nr:hypothetical protein [bacterium]